MPGAPGAVAAFVPPEPAAGEGLVFPKSDTMPLTDADLTGKDAATLRLARNEILARRGQIFADKALAEHFAKFDWYKPLTDEPSARTDRAAEPRPHPAVSS